MNIKRKLRLLVVLAGVLSLFVVLLPASPAFAHGGLTYPATRTYACYVDGIESGQGGDLDPSNPACIEAIARGDKTPLWNWFGNLLSDAGDRHREVIPDGNLCGPAETYSPYRMARTDWPTTRVQPGANVTIRYNAWAAHPGTWYQYITRDGWNPNEPLGWDDLEPAPFDQVTNPPINGSGPYGAEYTWPATLPNKQGRHLIFSIWERSDSPEAFYNCSDVFFGSGDIEYEIGVDNPGPGPDPDPDPDPGPDPDPDPDPNASCSVDYAIVSEWNNGFVADVTITNNGSAAVQGWTLDWRFSGNEEVTNSWNTSLVQNDDGSVEAGNAGWNGTIGAGQSVNFGFQVSRTGDGPDPTAFSLNGSPCNT